MDQKIKLDDRLGKQLRKFRLLQGYECSELARYMQLSGCDITRECIVKIEVGKHNVSMAQLKSFKDAFKVSYNDIFSFLEEK